jgi:hypothetical protein
MQCSVAHPRRRLRWPVAVLVCAHAGILTAVLCLELLAVGSARLGSTHAPAKHKACRSWLPVSILQWRVATLEEFIQRQCVPRFFLHSTSAT